MKRILSTLSIVFFCTLFGLCGCIQSSYTDTDTLRQTYSENRQLFSAAAEEALSRGDSVYISTYEFFRPEGSDSQATGMYVHDLTSGETTGLECDVIESLFETCSVNSLGVKVEGEVRLCEFSIGGGRQYFNGIYYADPDRSLFLNNFAVPLIEDGEGYSYSVENMNYYTEKWDDHFYYYVAKTR